MHIVFLKHSENFRINKTQPHATEKLLFHNFPHILFEKLNNLLCINATVEDYIAHNNAGIVQ